jgi:hypothetical protein
MILSRKYGIAIIMAVIIFIPNVCAIKMSVSSGNGMSYSGNYHMDTSASLQDNVLLNGEGIFQDTKASGTGKNAIIQSIGGIGYSGENSLVTSGSFSTSSSSVVTSNAGMISRDVSANGDASIGATASAATGTAMQQAGVNNGALSSSQILAIGGSAFAGQNTAIVGDAGTIDSSNFSPGDQAKTIDAYFIGGGNLDAQLASISGQESGMQGTASFNGMEVVNTGILQELDSGEVEMAIDGLYQSQSGGIGAFGFAAASTAYSTASSKEESTKLAAALPTVQVQGAITKDGSHAEIVNAPLGDAKSFDNWGVKINKPIQLYLRADSNVKAEGLDATKVASAVSSAANTWDYWTKPNQNNLFQPNVIIDASKASDKKDGYNVVSFIPISNSWLAYTRTWYSGRYISEADMCFNMKYQWTTDWRTAQEKGIYDVQTVALHELGHYAGLGDLYTLPQSDPRYKDNYAIMNRYDDAQHNLGAGDIAGIRKIYGA